MAVGQRTRFTGQEVLICFLCWLHQGMTFIELAAFVFGGDSRDFSYMMKCAVKHIYITFYHKVSGCSLEFWMDYLNDFRAAIFNRLTSFPEWWEIVSEPELAGPMDLSLDSF